ncbi:MAG: hypothetical protein RIR97_1743, partial [Pseudomonadota bacterium]
RDELTGPVMVIIGESVAGANFKKSTPLVRDRSVLREFHGSME